MEQKIKESNTDKKDNFKTVGIIFGIIFIFFGGINILESFFKEKPNDFNYESYSTSYGDNYYRNEYNTYEEEVLPVGFEGTDTMEACKTSTGDCYDLDIDSDGENIERINFPNGGYRDVYSSDCEDGYCVVEDEDGNEWELSY